MEKISGVLLGTLGLFYPLLIAFVIVFIYALIKRSWLAMLASAIVLYPDAWYFSGYPPFPWAKYFPVIPLLLAFIFFIMRNRRQKKVEWL
ncbi:MAG: hypothetical protein ACO1OC_08650 [Tuberibacillus sp.]